MALSDPGEGAGEMTPRSALGRLALSRAITYAGGSAAFLAVASRLYEQTHSETLVAAALLASFSVPALLSPLAGAIVDRFDRRRVLAGSELAGALLFAAMALLPSAPALLGLRVAASLAAAPLAPASSAALPSLLGGEGELRRANARLERAGAAGVLIGPLLAGALLPAAGAAAVFLANAASFLASAALIGSIKADLRAPRRQGSRPGQLGAGARALRSRPLLRSASFAQAIMFFGVGVAAPAEIALVSSFGAGSLGYGALVSLWAAGGLCGAHLAGLADRRASSLLILSAAGASALAFFAVASAPVFAAALGGMALAGIADGLWRVGQRCLTQGRVPSSLHGRAFAASEAVEQGALAAGFLLSGAAVAAVAVEGAFAVAGAGSLLAALVLSPRFIRPAAPASSAPSPLTRDFLHPLATLQGREPGAGSPSLGVIRPAPSLARSDRGALWAER